MDNGLCILLRILIIHFFLWSWWYSSCLKQPYLFTKIWNTTFHIPYSGGRKGRALLHFPFAHSLLPCLSMRGLSLFSIPRINQVPENSQAIRTTVLFLAILQDEPVISKPVNPMIFLVPIATRSQMISPILRSPSQNSPMKTSSPIRNLQKSLTTGAPETGFSS